MQELSLNILDIAQNSIAAQATVIEIEIEIDKREYLSITITDNGKGMDQETLSRVTNPFYTSRTTRRVGLGIPLFKQAAESTGGFLEISSQKGKGTKVVAVFDTSSIDYTPLGAVWDTVAALIQMNENIDFIYKVKKNNKEFVCDTRQLREIMEGAPLSSIQVVSFIKEYIKENQQEILQRSY